MSDKKLQIKDFEKNNDTMIYKYTLNMKPYCSY